MPKTVSEILRSVGYPEEVLVIDFESYFDQDYGFNKLSTIEYITDERFDFTGVGTALDGKFHFAPGPDVANRMEWLQIIYGSNLSEVTIVAKNCKYDITVLTTKFNIMPLYVIDVDDLLRHFDSRMSHKMKDVTKLFRLQAKGETKQFKGFHYEEMDTEMREALSTYCLNDIDIEVKLFEKLLPMMTCHELEIPSARSNLQLYLEPHFKFDFAKADDLKLQMLVEQKRSGAPVGCTLKELSGDLSFVELLQAALPEGEKIPVKKGKPGKNMIRLLGKPGVIPQFAKTDQGFQDLLIHPVKYVADLCIARQAVKSWPSWIKRINNMTAQAHASGGLLRTPLHYFGCHTGRKSGGEKINLQNLGGRGRGGAGTHPLISAIRSLLCAPDGHTLGIVDSAQIEARVLAWMANQMDLLDGFAKGEDIYSVFATKLFNSTVYKPKDDEFPPIKRLLKIRRGFGKDSILGCGYGMGAPRFYNNCLSNCDLRPMFDSGQYTRQFIEKLIKTYRTTYTNILQFWTDLEKAFKWVIKYPHEHAKVSKKYTADGKADGFRLLLFNKNGTVHLRLPSRRELTYRHCSLKKGKYGGDEIRWHYGHLWGGSICENVIQAIARDLLMWWILEMERHGLIVVLDVHDEIVCVLPEDTADQALQLMITIMCTNPDWAYGLPLDAEGSLSKRYTK